MHTYSTGLNRPLYPTFLLLRLSSTSQLTDQTPRSDYHHSCRQAIFLFLPYCQAAQVLLLQPQLLPLSRFLLPFLRFLLLIRSL